MVSLYPLCFTNPHLVRRGWREPTLVDHTGVQLDCDGVSDDLTQEPRGVFALALGECAVFHRVSGCAVLFIWFLPGV